jgi:hypothetical protein
LGHYEKVDKNVQKYFYVESDKPSGLPNSFVISEKEAKAVRDKKGLSDMRITDRYNIH